MLSLILMYHMFNKTTTSKINLMGAACYVTTIYRDEIYSLQILLSRTHAWPGRTERARRNFTQPCTKNKSHLCT